MNKDDKFALALWKIANALRVKANSNEGLLMAEALDICAIGGDPGRYARVCGAGEDTEEFTEDDQKALTEPADPVMIEFI